ncbi:hypothetical protein AAFC00_004661 [Neodothiora populina]|uniref:Polyprenal reductase n=1 Tax=Neodothiora populina TaxID=2781224 RepID=A0ABR3P2S5_9PEZI
MDAVTAMRACYVVVAFCIAVAGSVPILSKCFLTYGSRETIQASGEGKTNNAAVQLINTLATIRVPHSWFASFYVVSVACSILWASQMVLDASIVRTVAAAAKQRSHSMSIEQVAVTWLLMLLQGTRRLYECMTLTKPSSSQMWIGHWAFGLWFYTTTSVAVWIEGSSALLSASQQAKHISLQSPSLRTVVGITGFFVASAIQHYCHAYLASLKKYTVPSHPLFHRVVCPHYLAECLIYMTMSLVAAPRGCVFNRTLLAALFLVAVNLGITADGTKTWYRDKFGKQSVESRWRMIPFIY